ncbi:unnamed protein product [Porites evermanni]|uniref:RRM domain-containing protein n=1 Tax=Porites evermanni TaxID=104178 RepID=A0ABN8LCE3_9CNID|nr:unnamed protein product [Porites evermanni]
MSRSCQVYMGRLPYGTKERDIEKFFRNYGRLREINLKNGYGFVEFEDSRDAEDAVYECNGKEMMGERIIVEPSRGTARGAGASGGRKSRARDKYGPPVRTPWRITVENLSTRVSWQDLKDYVRQAGEVTYGDAHKQRKGEGTLEFATKRDLKRVMKKLDGTELNGKRIKLVDVICVAQIFYYHFCRKVHVLDLVLVLDQEAAPDPKDGLDPSRVLLHNHATTVLNRDHVLDHDPDRHDANRIPSRAQGPGRDPVHDLRANPSPDHVHVHALDLDHPEMIKKHLRNRKLMIIRIIIQQKEIGPVKLMMLSDKLSFS